MPPLKRSFIRFPTRVEFGAGMLAQLGGIARPFGKRAYVIFDPFFEGSQTAARALSFLHEAGVETIENYNTRPNPRAADMDEKAAECVQNGCDLVIALGGGSAIDIGKAVAMVATNGRSSWNYAALETHPYEEITEPPLPLIAVPTTSGTGSEATIYSVVTNPDLQRKCSIRSFLLYPAVALIDPELMTGIPQQLTAMTGIDTFAHAYESYTNIKSTYFSRMIALESMRLFAENIETCCFHGDNVEARGAMAYAALLGGMAIAHCPCTIGHVLGQCLSGWTDAPHGGSLATCTAPIIRWTLPEGLPQLAAVARVFDRALPEDDRAAAHALPDLLNRLFERILGGRVTMRTYGLTEAQQEPFSAFIYENYQGDMGNYVKVPTLNDIRFLVRQCCG
ncbi:iron-containing alcohol dehydrogenase [Agathobaculum sp.]|uniref:iron-containing alcohol dehydrogenase n=1 Tax=Agathobaculum sp. TaxID=2048138 RepID=UPI002A8004F2|nr:iron-containing alcohol dehydrogenase [Agathobaculum sp.]MDY3618635.1 iron-containing alcohol dehydrogenase [Agathobaculum sp.]